MSETVDAAAANALVVELLASPDDIDLRTRAARALVQTEREQQAVALLSERLINLTAHEGPPLPCLCKRCLDPAAGTASVDGVEFRRDFAVRDGRVLFFWVPSELFGARGLREAVTERMRRSTARSRGVR